MTVAIAASNKVTSVRVLRDESSKFVTKAGVLELKEPIPLIDRTILKAIATLSCQS